MCGHYSSVVFCLYIDRSWEGELVSLVRFDAVETILSVGHVDEAAEGADANDLRETASDLLKFARFPILLLHILVVNCGFFFVILALLFFRNLCSIILVDDIFACEE